jgi:hypothetical protein
MQEMFSPPAGPGSPPMLVRGTPRRWWRPSWSNVTMLEMVPWLTIESRWT